MAIWRTALVSTALILSTFANTARASEATDKLLTALGMEQMIRIMREEGLTYAVELGDEMLPGGYSDSFGANVARIYDTDAMEQSVRAGFAAALDGTDINALEVFFASPLGTRIVALEISAREAMMDSAIEDAAKERARQYEAEDDAAFLKVQDFIKEGDLLEANVVGALNSNIQFYRGLVDGEAFALSEAEIVADVWEQVDATRAETREWLYAFLIMAYAPLDAEGFDAYAQLLNTPEGRVMTRALFQGFDSMYGDISYALGLACARAMQAEEI